MRLFIGNLPRHSAHLYRDVVDLFAPFGRVDWAHVVLDKESGKPKGIAFVEMPDEDAAGRAIVALNGSEYGYGGRILTVRKAWPKPDPKAMQAGESAGEARG